MKSRIITLKSNDLSNRISKESIDQAAKFNINVEYFEAVNGLESHTEHFERLGVVPKKKMKAGALGCALSHISLWKKCIEDNEPYLILEHDGYFIEPLPLDILDKFEDVLKLDNCNPYKESYEQDIEEKSKEELQIQDIEKDQELLGAAGYYSRGAYAYIIKPQAADKLLKWIEVNGFIKADHQLGFDICTISTVNKTLARLHPFYLGRVKSLSTTNFLGKDMSL